MTLRDELIQVAAVAVATIQDIDTGSTEMQSGYVGTVLGDIANERDRQEAKWGLRSNVPIAEWMTILGEEYGECCKAALEEVMYPDGAGIGGSE